MADKPKRERDPLLVAMWRVARAGELTAVQSGNGLMGPAWRRLREALDEMGQRPEDE